MALAINRKTAEALILRTYSEFYAPLNQLKNLISSFDSAESRKIAEIYTTYTEALGGEPCGEYIDKKANVLLGPEIAVSSNDELIDMLKECQELARLYDLPVKHELPTEEIVIDNRTQDESIRYLSIEFFQQDERNDEKSIFLNGLFSHLYFDPEQQKIVWRIFNPNTLTSMESGRFTLTGEDGTVWIQNRTVDNQFWINAFVKGRNDIASNLTMYVDLTFYSEADAVSYCNAFNHVIDQKINQYFASNKYPENTRVNFLKNKRKDEDVKKSLADRSGRNVSLGFR